MEDARSIGRAADIGIGPVPEIDPRVACGLARIERIDATRIVDGVDARTGAQVVDGIERAEAGTVGIVAGARVRIRSIDALHREDVGDHRRHRPEAEPDDPGRIQIVAHDRAAQIVLRKHRPPTA